MKRLLFTLLLLVQAAAAALPDPSPEKLPRWRGFNLLEKFIFSGKREAFREEDFRLISEMGFNFVRLPMDYRGWIRGGDWEALDEAALQQIDEAVAWGGKYGLHVCLNFHRAPGYTVAQPPEARDLWTDPEAQRVCALHWAAFAKRYRGVPNARLSFNLLNEPADIDRGKFLAVMRLLVDAIRKEDPPRLIICDSLKWGTVPVEEFATLKVAAATRGYTPMEISHYGASWVNSASFPEPAWPRTLGSNGLLFGSWKKELAQPLVITGPFAEDAVLRIRVGVVSTKAQLVITGGGAALLEKNFECGPGEGEWKTANYDKEWKTWQNLYDRDYTVKIPAGTPEISLSIKEGDWLEVRELGITSGGAESRVTCDQQYGKKPGPLRWQGGRLMGAVQQDGAWLKANTIDPWQRVEKLGTGVIVGEWGAFNRTPHDVTLRWAEDCLRNWQQAGWGWALWNFRGPFGVLDSGRSDVNYEEYHGHKLDRKLLELLQKY